LASSVRARARSLRAQPRPDSGHACSPVAARVPLARGSARRALLRYSLAYGHVPVTSTHSDAGRRCRSRRRPSLSVKTTVVSASQPPRRPAARGPAWRPPSRTRRASHGGHRRGRAGAAEARGGPCVLAFTLCSGESAMRELSNLELLRCFLALDVRSGGGLRTGASRSTTVRQCYWEMVPV
jgi:hypothetical protein